MKSEKRGRIEREKGRKKMRRKEAVLLKLCVNLNQPFLSLRGKGGATHRGSSCSLGGSPYSRTLLICISQQGFLLEKWCFCPATQVAVFAVDGSR